jgi:redox-sensing transcriptional repressor
VHVKTNKRSVSRLSRYRNLLSRLKTYNVKWVYSEEIAAGLGITAAQVRKDFSHFGVSGKRKTGYHVDSIFENINKILGKNDRNKVIIAGFGSLGMALYNDYLSHDNSLQVVAAFDDSVHAETQNSKDSALPVYPLSSLITYATENGIKFGVIALADKTAQKALDLMILGGIRGILSLSPVELKSSKKCFLNTINVFREFENVVFFAGKTGHP